MMTRYILAIIASIALSFAQSSGKPPDSVERLLDEIVKNEQEFLVQMRVLNPIMETYEFTIDDL